MPSFDSRFEQFIADHFDSEEAVMIVLTLRKAARALTAGEVFDQLLRYGVDLAEERRLAEKRVELRMRDLAGHGLVRRETGGRFVYATSEAATDELVDRLIVEFEQHRTDLNRLIYGSAARARRLAEAFRL